MMYEPPVFEPVRDVGESVPTLRQVIKIAKPSQSDILPTRKVQFLRRIELMEAELGRMQKLLNELRADALHLTTE